VVLVAFSNPLDQYFMKHPEALFDSSHEHAIIDLENPYIVIDHLMCAAAELPLTLNDNNYFPSLFEDCVTALEKQLLIRNTPKGWVYSGRVRPVSLVNLNNISNKIVTVKCKGDILETMDLTKAYHEAHQGAVLLHQGETYIVEELDLQNLLAKVRKDDVNYFTEPRKTVEIELKKIHEEQDIGIDIGIGEVEVTEFFHYFVLKTYDEILGRTALNLPPLAFSTIGLWFKIPEVITKEIEDQDLDFAGGLHAVEHALISIAPLYAMCDRWDIGGVSTPIHSDTGRPTIFIYDGCEGGIGISEKLYEMIEMVFSTTLRLIMDCECKEGCPSCIYSSKCGNENEPLDKNAAILILDRVQKMIQTKKC